MMMLVAKMMTMKKTKHGLVAAVVAAAAVEVMFDPSYLVKTTTVSDLVVEVMFGPSFLL